MSIHPTAIISSSAKLGAGVRIGPYAVIDDEVELGDGCIIGPHVVIHRYTSLGQDCRVHAGAVLGDVPQDIAFDEVRSFVRVGDRCVIREGVTIHRGTCAESETRVGQDCLLMANCHLGHNVTVGDQVVIANGSLLAGHVEVGERAFLSGNCLVHQFTRIGKLTMMSGASAVNMDVPPFCITRGATGNTVMHLNVIGLKRSGFTTQQRRNLKLAFDILYRSDLSVSTAVEQLERDFSCPHVRELAAFVKSSQRGICKFFRDPESDFRLKLLNAA